MLLYKPQTTPRPTLEQRKLAEPRNIGVDATLMILSDAVRQALTSGNLAHLVTLNPDGSPQVTVVWVGLDGDEIVCGHMRLHKKVQNVQKDARVAISMLTGGKTGDLDNYLVIDGRARITEGGAADLLNKLARIYVRPGITFIPEGAPPGYITRITAERLHGVGPWNLQP